MPWIPKSKSFPINQGPGSCFWLGAMRLRVLVALVVVVVAAGPAPVAWADEGGLSGVEDGEVLPEDVAQGFDVQGVQASS